MWNSISAQRLELPLPHAGYRRGIKLGNRPSDFEMRYLTFFADEKFNHDRALNLGVEGGLGVLRSRNPDRLRRRLIGLGCSLGV